MHNVRTTLSHPKAIEFVDMAVNAGHVDRSTRRAKRRAKELGGKQMFKNHFKTATMDGLSILNFAVKDGHLLLANLLMEELDVDPNTTQYDKNGRTTLHYAATTGRLELVTKLLTTYNSDAGARDKCGSTPLHLAIFNDHPECAEKIVELAPNVGRENHFGMAIHAAAFTGCTAVVTAIAARYPDQVNAVISGFVTPLVCAIFGDEPACESILKQVVPLAGKALIYKVVSFKSDEAKAFESVSSMLELGADPNLSEELLYEDLAIICAAKKGWSSVVSLLRNETVPIPDVTWTVDGLMDHVKTEDFIQRDAKRVVTRVNQLKLKILEDLNTENCLSALIVCMSLKYDMNTEEWDHWASLCKFVIYMLFQACPIRCNHESIYEWVLTWASVGNHVWSLIGVKGCLALNPNNPEYQSMYTSLSPMPAGNRIE